MLIMCYLILMFTVAVTKSAMHFGGTLENTGTGYTGTDIQVSGIRIYRYTDIWVYGYTGIWLYRYTDIRVNGYTDIREYGCTDTKFRYLVN